MLAGLVLLLLLTAVGRILIVVRIGIPPANKLALDKLQGVQAVDIGGRPVAWTPARTVAVRRNVTLWAKIDVSDTSDGSDRRLQYCSDKKGLFYPNCHLKLPLIQRLYLAPTRLVIRLGVNSGCGRAGVSGLILDESEVFLDVV
jgi:hypothetical protein